MALNQLGLGFVFTAKDLASASMTKMTGNFGEMDKAAKKAKESLDRFAVGETLKVMGEKLREVSTKGLEFFAAAGEAGESFEQALKLVATRVDEAHLPMESLDELANKLAKTFATSPIEQAKALYEAVGAGARDAASAEGVMTAANSLARATATDLGTALGGVTQLLKAYHLDMQEAATVADSMFIATKHSGQSLGELSGMLAHFAPLGERAGLSVNELLGSISALGKAGIQGRPALAGMRAVMEALITPSKEAQAEARRLGISFNAAAVQAKGLPGVLESIEASGRMNKKTLEQLFGGVEGTTAAMALMRNGGQGLTESLNEMATGAGAAGKAADSMITPQQRMHAALEQITTKIGQAVLPILDALAKAVTVVVGWFSKIPKPILTVISGAAMLALGFAGLIGTIAAMAAAVALISIGFEAFAVAVVVLTGAVAVLAAGLVFLGGPLALLLYGAKVAFDKNLGGIRDTIEEVVDRIKLAWEALTEVFDKGGFSASVSKELSAHPRIKAFVIDVFMWGSRLKSFFSALSDGFGAAMGRLEPTFKALSEAFDRLGAAMGFNGASDPAANAAKFDKFGEAGAKVGDVLAKIVGYAAQAVTWILNVAAAAGEFVQKHQKTFDELGDAITGVFSAIGDVASALGELSAAFSGGQSNANGFGTQLGAVVLGGLKVVTGAVRGLTMVLHALRTAIHTVASVWDYFYEKAKAAADKVRAILAPLAGAIDSVAGALGMHPGVAKALAAHPAATEPAGAVYGPPRPGGGVLLPEGPVALPGPWAPSARSTLPSTNVAAAAAEAQAQNLGGGGHPEELTGAIREGFAQKRPDNVTIPVAVYLDSEKVADALGARGVSLGARGFNPQPAPG